MAMGVTLAQQVKVVASQADIQRFEPHLGHNWLSCGVFLVKSRYLGLSLAQTIIYTKLAVSLSGWLSRCTNMEYLQSTYRDEDSYSSKCEQDITLLYLYTICIAINEPSGQF